MTTAQELEFGSSELHAGHLFCQPSEYLQSLSIDDITPDGSNQRRTIAGILAGSRSQELGTESIPEYRDYSGKTQFTGEIVSMARGTRAQTYEITPMLLLPECFECNERALRSQKASWSATIKHRWS